jgi:hypothetical protein
LTTRARQQTRLVRQARKQAPPPTIENLLNSGGGQPLTGTVTISSTAAGKAVQVPVALSIGIFDCCRAI